jgi:hypothetical protein
VVKARCRGRFGATLQASLGDAFEALADADPAVEVAELA